MPRGSWPVLLLLTAAFAAAFAWQHHRSPFLRIERDLAAAREVAARHGLEVVDALALRELSGVDAGIGAWDALAARFAAERVRLGPALAVVAAVGDRDAAMAALAAAGDPEAAWRAFMPTPAALPGLRFLAVRQRFALRAAVRD